MKKIILFLVLLCLCCATVIVGSANSQVDAEALMKQVPVYSYSGKDETIKTVVFGSYTDVNTVVDILFRELFRAELIPEDMEEFSHVPTDAEIAECPKVSVEDLNKTFDRLFGPNAHEVLSGKDFISTGVLSLHLLDDGKNFAYVPRGFAGGVGSSQYTKLIRSETTGEDIVIYVRFADYPPAGYGDIFYIYGNATRKTEDVTTLLPQISNADLKGDLNPWTRLEKGEFDEYLPVYKHTFKPNGDGTYYWAKTELETAGKEIPLSVIGDSVEVVPSNTSSSTETNLPTTDGGNASGGETVGQVTTDGGTETTAPLTEVTDGTDDTTAISSNGDETGDSALWIYVAAGLGVALVIALGVFFAVKKKKA